MSLIKKIFSRWRINTKNLKVEIDISYNIKVKEKEFCNCHFWNALINLIKCLHRQLLWREMDKCRSGLGPFINNERVKGSI